MNPDRKIIIGQLDTGKFAAAVTASPYYCFVADTEKEALRLVDETAKLLDRIHGYLSLAAPVEDQILDDAEDALDTQIARERLADVANGNEPVVSGDALDARLSVLMGD